MKKVSAIITTHNRIKLLKRAIDSVLAQTYSNIELIIVDDNSNDGTREYCKNINNIKYIYISSEESRGGNFARNKGIKYSTGEYVAFLDDDDYWLPNKIEEQILLLEESKSGLVYCGFIKENINRDKVTFNTVLPLTSNSGDMNLRILTTIPTTTSNIIVSKKLLERIGYFDENLKFWQEYELLIRLAQLTPFNYVNKALTIYRIDNSDSARLTNKFESWKKAVEYIHFKHGKLYKKLNPLQKLYAKSIVWNDARRRCKSSHNIQGQIKYTILSFPVRLFRKITGT